MTKLKNKNLVEVPDGYRLCKVHDLLPESCFYLTIRRNNYHYYTCKLCSKISSAARAKAHPGDSTARARKSRANPLRQGRDKIYYDNNKEKRREANKRYRQQLRLEVLRHYSNSDVPFCSCCKENTFHFLALDHKHGGGNKHRKELGGSATKVYSWVKAQGFPNSFRVLCHNCNHAFAILGSCPHNTSA